MCFSKQRKPTANPLLFLDGVPLPIADEVRYPGVILDKILHWNSHTKQIEKKVDKLTNHFRILGHYKHGPSIEALCTLYKALIRSRQEYGWPAYGSTSPSLQNKIEVIQYKFLRAIMGAPKTTLSRNYSVNLAWKQWRRGVNG